MSVIVHLSDTHFGTELPEVVRDVEHTILAVKPDIVILTGDITQRARPGQFRAAAAFMDHLPAETKFVIPGNHDIPLFNIPMRLVRPYHHYLHAFALREGVWCHGNIGLIGFDATSRWRHTRGYVDDAAIVARVKQARALLKPGALLFACAHQPLVTAWQQDEENILIDASRTARLLAEHGVDLVMSGHVHVPLISTTKTAFPDLKKHFVLSGAGTAVSHRTRPGAPNSFNIIRVTENLKISITLMEYADSRFTPRLEKTFANQQDGWEQVM